MHAYGATEQEILDAIKSMNQPLIADVFTVDYDNWMSWEVFRRCSSQWIRAGMSGQPVALDYSAVTSVISLFNADDPLSVFDGVQYIEHGYMSKL